MAEFLVEQRVRSEPGFVQSLALLAFKVHCSRSLPGGSQGVHPGGGVVGTEENTQEQWRFGECGQDSFSLCSGCLQYR